MSVKIEELFGADLRSLGAMRIGLSLIIIADLCQRATDLDAHYTDFGLAPRTLVIENLSSRWYSSFHLLSGQWQLQAMLFVAAGLFACALMVGYRTRLATISSWAFLVSLDVRNFHILAGGDFLLRVVLFWSMFLPLGARYSVDYAWANPNSKIPKRVFSLGTSAFVAQILVLYWASALSKSGVEWWREGSAVYYALSIDYIVTPLGHWLLEFPPAMLRFVTWSVLGYEIVGPFLLLSPWLTGPVRTAAILGFVLLHSAILLTLLIGIFPLVAIVSILFFLPSWFWDKLLPQYTPSRGKAITIYYDGDCGFCWRGVQLIKTFLLSPNAQILPAQSSPVMETAVRLNDSWIVLDESGREFLRYEGVLVIIGSSKLLGLLSPIFKLAPVQRLGERLYCYVGKHRSGICRVPSFAQGSYAKPSLSRGGSVLACGFLIYVIIWNLANLPYLPINLSERARSLGNLVGLDQRWEMFAPFPAKDDGWYVLPGLLKDGRLVDVYRNGAEIDWHKPKYIVLTIKNHRWRKFFELLRQRSFLPPAYAGYLCRKWNRSHTGNNVLQKLQIIFMVEWTRPNFEYFEPRKLEILDYQCAQASPKN